MAIGQIFPLSPFPPATLAAVHAVIVGGSTPTETVPVFAFNDTTVEYMDFYGRLEGYDDGGLTLRISWSATSITGDVIWGAAVRRMVDDTEDVDTSHTYVYNDTSALAAPDPSHSVSEDSITFTNGTDMDSLVDTEAFILRVRRNTAGDADMSGDADPWYPALTLFETA